MMVILRLPNPVLGEVLGDPNSVGPTPQPQWGCWVQMVCTSTPSSSSLPSMLLGKVVSRRRVEELKVVLATRAF